MTINPTDFNQINTPTRYAMDFDNLMYSTADNPGLTGKESCIFELQFLGTKLWGTSRNHYFCKFFLSLINTCLVFHRWNKLLVNRFIYKLVHL